MPNEAAQSTQARVSTQLSNSENTAAAAAAVPQQLLRRLFVTYYGVKKYKAKGCLVTGAILGMVTMNTNMNPILVIIALQLQHFTVTLGVGVLEVFPDTR